jgi:hypothetical protein
MSPIKRSGQRETWSANNIICLILAIIAGISWACAAVRRIWHVVGLLVRSLSAFELVEHFSESFALKLGHFISIIGVTTVCESLGSLVHLKYGLIVLLFDTTVLNTCLLNSPQICI